MIHYKHGNKREYTYISVVMMVYIYNHMHWSDDNLECMQAVMFMREMAKKVASS